ncbi:MAG: hypothetical protein HQL32_08435 [Planctomycetes bacterium]|nr:hypothetical protein [Planctomycetota bacterium]
MTTRQNPRSYRDLFSLTELILVITIFTVMTSLLLPSFSNMMKHSRTTSCLMNQKFIGQAMSLYITDYDNSFPANNINEYGAPVTNVSWDDLLSPYDGRDLSSEHIDAAFLRDESTLKPNLPWVKRSSGRVYFCPEDDVSGGKTTRVRSGDVIHRSYAINGHFLTENDVKNSNPPEPTGSWVRFTYSQKVGGIWVPGISYKRLLTGVSLSAYSAKFHEIADSSGTISIVDAFKEYSYLGDGNSDSNIQEAFRSFHHTSYEKTDLGNLSYPDVHGLFQANYLFCDGSAKKLYGEDTVGDQNLMTKRAKIRGMWTGTAGD